MFSMLRISERDVSNGNEKQKRVPESILLRFLFNLLLCICFDEIFRCLVNGRTWNVRSLYSVG